MFTGVPGYFVELPALNSIGQNSGENLAFTDPDAGHTVKLH